MNSENQDSQKNDHKPSEDDGPQTLALLQKIKDGQINPKSIGKKEGKLLVRFLKNENKSTPEIAHVLGRSDRTIRRYIEELEEEDVITKEKDLAQLCYELRHGRLFPSNDKIVDTPIERLTELDNELGKQKHEAIKWAHYLLLARVRYLRGKCYRILSELNRSIGGGAHKQIVSEKRDEAIHRFQDSIQLYHYRA